MLTPVFNIVQDSDFLTITIKAPFTKVSKCEVEIDEQLFLFVSNPYYLRLNLPACIVKNGSETGTFDADLGTYTFKCPKKNPGEEFVGLDMMTKLLSAPSHYTIVPNIQVTDSSAIAPDTEASDNSALTPGTKEIDNLSKDVSLDTEESWNDWLQQTLGAEAADVKDGFCWEIKQELKEDEIVVNAPKYGFANHYSGVLGKLQLEVPDIVDVRNVDVVAESRRKKLRLEEQLTRFDEDHYLADLYEEKRIQELLSYKVLWLEKSTEAESLTEFEKDQLQKLPRKELLIDDSKQLRSVCLSLVDIIFAYAYNKRTTEGENTVESAWTICKLSSTLSWLESFRSLDDVLLTCYQRSLIYPLFRNWKLTDRVLRDCQEIFKSGRVRILKCLLEIHHLFCKSESRYILNYIYITDYCIWIQSASESLIKSLAKSLSKITIAKTDLGMDLEILERAADLVIKEEKGNEKYSEQLENNMHSLSLESDSHDNTLLEGHATNDAGKCDSDDDNSDSINSPYCTDSSESSDTATDDDDDDKTASDGETLATNHKMDDDNKASNFQLLTKSIDKLQLESPEKTDRETLNY